MLCIFKKPLLLNILEREPCMSVVKPYRDVTFLQITLAGEYDVTKWTHWFTMLLIGHSHHCLLHMVNFTLYTVTFSSMYDVTVAFLKNSFSRGFLFDEDYYKRKLFRPTKKTPTHIITTHAIIVIQEQWQWHDLWGRHTLYL